MSDTSPRPTSADLRAGNADRDVTVEALGAHYAAGRLDDAELDERTAVALAARTRGELAALLKDLPPAPTPHAPTPHAPAPRSDEGFVARARVLWGTTVLTPWAVMAVVFVMIWLTTGAGYFWPVWPIMGWGIGVATTGVLAYRLPAEFLARRQRRACGASR